MFFEDRKKAFVLDSRKVDAFLQSEKRSDVVLERFRAHQPKEGVITPYKKGERKEV